MNKRIQAEMETIYSDWLMEYCPEEIHSSDDLLKFSEERRYFDEFVRQIKEEF